MTNAKKALDEAIDQLGNTDWYMNLHYRRLLKVLRWIDARVPVASRGLEIGVWPGYLGLALNNLGYQETGIDLAPKRLPDLGFTTLQADLNVNPLPFSDESFDFISCSEVVEHLNPQTLPYFLKELRRVLKAGGLLFLTTPNKSRLGLILDKNRAYTENDGHGHELEYGLGEIKRMADQCGFTIEEAATISFYSSVGIINHGRYFYPIRNFLKYPNKKHNLLKLLICPVITLIPRFKDSQYLIATKKINDVS